MDNRHFVNQHVISPPFPAHLERIIVAVSYTHLTLPTICSV